MRWLKLLSLLCLLPFIVSCSSMLSQKTVATLYHTDGTKMADLYNNKSYSGLKWSCQITPHGTVVMDYSAEEVNSASVAKEAVLSQGKAIDALTAVIERIPK